MRAVGDKQCVKKISATIESRVAGFENQSHAIVAVLH